MQDTFDICLAILGCTNNEALECLQRREIKMSSVAFGDCDEMLFTEEAEEFIDRSDAAEVERHCDNVFKKRSELDLFREKYEALRERFAAWGRRGWGWAGRRGRGRRASYSHHETPVAHRTRGVHARLCTRVEPAVR